MIANNLDQVNKNIRVHCKDKLVKLVAVSKTKPFDMIKEAYENGVRDFGENKAIELKEKYELSTDIDVNYHFIGHLQRNKVKYVIGRACLIHSLDSFRLAEKIEELASKKGIIVDALVQVNIGDEDSKFGIDYADVEEFIDRLSEFKHLRIRGLMCIAPYVDQAEENRVLFRKMHEVFIDIKDKNKDNVSMDILSMGMSNDYIVAIEEGATMVRVGSAIFGERNYSK